MKHWFLGLALICFGSQANAAPYFRILNLTDVHSYHVNMGSYIDPSGKAAPDHGGEVAVISHSHVDGYIFLPGEDYSLLSIGGVVNGQLQSKIAVGPQFNVLPIMQYIGGYALGLISPAGSFQNLRSYLQPALVPPSGADLAISVGPKFMYDPNGNKGYFRVFVGGVLSF